MLSHPYCHDFYGNSISHRPYTMEVNAVRHCTTNTDNFCLDVIYRLVVSQALNVYQGGCLVLWAA